MEVTPILDDLSGTVPAAFITSGTVGVPVVYVPAESAPSVASTTFFIHMPYGGAAVFNKSTQIWTTFPATVDDDGSCTLSGNLYGNPVAGSRGDVLNQAVLAINSLFNADLWISPGTFDTGGGVSGGAGNWTNINRNIWLDLSAGNLSLSGNAGFSSNSVYGAGSNLTQVLFTCDGSTWGKFCPIRLGANGSVVSGLKLTGYWDRPDDWIRGREFQAGDSDSQNAFLYDLYLDPVPWMLPDTTVLKKGYQPGAVLWQHAGFSSFPDATIESDIGAAGALSASIVNCTIYGGYGVIEHDGGNRAGQSINVYNSNLIFRLPVINGPGGAVISNYLGSGGLPGNLNLYNCVIDGGGIAVGAVSNDNSCVTGLYYHTTIQNMGTNTTAALSNLSGTINVAPSVVYPNSSGVITSVADVIPTVPSPPALSYLTPIFTTA